VYNFDGSLSGDLDDVLVLKGWWTGSLSDERVV